MVIVSILIPVNINDYEEYRNAYFGFPIAFIRQDLLASGADFQGDFPTNLGIRMDFLDNYPQYDFYLVRFIISVLLMYVIIICVRYLLRKLSTISG